MRRSFDAAPLVGDSPPPPAGHRQPVIERRLSSRTRADVTVTVLAADDRHVQLVVNRHGVGISADFYRTSSSGFARGIPLDAHARSLGLGLWLVKQIVDAHGGTVTAASEGPARDPFPRPAAHAARGRYQVFR